MKPHRYGVVLGRFQPLHIGHMEYLEAARSHCDRLIVGITNPDIRVLAHHDADPNRSKLKSNPFSYFLRFEMIDQSLRDAGWLADEYAIVPADITDLSHLGVHLPDPRQATVFITVYDQWGEEKERRLRELHYNVVILWRREMSDRLTSGTDIRKKMREQGAWRHLVPGGVAVQLERSGMLAEMEGKS